MERDINKLGKRIINGGEISFEEACALLSMTSEQDIDELVETAHEVFLAFQNKKADLCSLVNAKSGRCSEDCAFCAQSSHFNGAVNEYPLFDVDKIVQCAKEAEQSGAHRFCIVTSGKRLDSNDFNRVLDAFRAIREHTSLELDGSLGLLSDDEIKALREVGVTRINHNLETSERYFSNVCSTHTFRDRYKTIERLKQQGMQTCCGGIIGLGEAREDRVALAFSLKNLAVDCVPLNILNPRPGTPLEKRPRLTPQEIIKTIAIFRLILPRAIIKIAGGREVNLGEAQARALQAGANGIIIGGYLTTPGNSVKEDLGLIQSAGLEIK